MSAFVDFQNISWYQEMTHYLTAYTLANKKQETPIILEYIEASRVLELVSEDLVFLALVELEAIQQAKEDAEFWDAEDHEDYPALDDWGDTPLDQIPRTAEDGAAGNYREIRQRLYGDPGEPIVVHADYRANCDCRN